MLKQRLLTSAFLIPAFLAALFWLPDFYWATLMMAVIVIGAWEWGQLSGFDNSGRQIFCGLITLAGLLLLPGVWAGAQHYHVLFWSILAAASFWLLVVPLWLGLLHREARKPLMALVGLVVLLPAWMALIHLRKVSPFFLLALMAVVWLADSAAYFSGKKFGRNKLAPQISPGKTWEGVFGALAAVTIYGAILCQTLGISLWLIVGFWGLVIMSVVGDLFESLLKRQAGIKDSGNILPGHGGVLDRIDGLLPTLPLAAFYLHFPLYVAVMYE